MPDSKKAKGSKGAGAPTLAGKQSGVSRARAAKLRRFFVLEAFERLKPKYQYQPYSEESIDALEKEFRGSAENRDDTTPDVVQVSHDTGVKSRRQPPSERLEALLDGAISAALERSRHFGPSIYDASRETLKKDLKALGIRSNHRKRRSG